MKLKVLAVAAAALFSLNATASVEHYVSVGMSEITSEYKGDSVTIDGFGFNWNTIKQGSSVGIGMGMDFATNSVGSVDETMWDVNLNVPIRFKSAEWLLVYPTVGMSFYTVDAPRWSDSDTGINFGLGATAQIPSTNVFLEANYKIHNMSGDMFEGVDVDSLYFGIGYKF